MTIKKIGIIALSAPAEATRVARAKARLASFGIEAVFPIDPSQEYGQKTFLFAAASADARARALEGLFADRRIDAILSLRGAYGTMEVLEHFDFEVAKANPKPFIGFSDSTAMLLPLHHLAQCPVIHGPGFEGAFGAEGNESDRIASAERLVSFLRGQSYQTQVTQLLGSSEDVTGEALGGNLSMLSAMVGSRFLSGFAHKILFFEEVGEKPFRIHRMLLQLKLAGAFHGLKGVLIGDMLKCEHPAGQGPTWLECVEDIFKSSNIPVFQVPGIGHGARNSPLPFGITLKIRHSSLEVPSLSAL